MALITKLLTTDEDRFYGSIHSLENQFRKSALIRVDQRLGFAVVLAKGQELRAKT
jgi:hypothetical protein